MQNGISKFEVDDGNDESINVRLRCIHDKQEKSGEDWVALLWPQELVDFTLALWEGVVHTRTHTEGHCGK